MLLSRGESGPPCGTPSSVLVTTPSGITTFALSIKPMSVSPSPSPPRRHTPQRYVLWLPRLPCDSFVPVGIRDLICGTLGRNAVGALGAPPAVRLDPRRQGFRAHAPHPLPWES